MAIGCLAYGLVMAFREEVSGWLARAAIAGLAGAILGVMLSYAIKHKEK